METAATIEDTAAAGQAARREPRQERSKESLQRMLDAARALLLELGNEDFTLQDVSRRGQVSIGSIYLRFESKDTLVRTVLLKALADLAADEDRMFARLGSEYDGLDRLVPQLVAQYAELLREHAPLLRLAMDRADRDQLMAEPGKRAAQRAMDMTADTLLRHADEFGAGDRQLKAASAYQVIFATLARKLSLGSSLSAVEYDWAVLKRELGNICLAYLKAG